MAKKFQKTLFHCLIVFALLFGALLGIPMQSYARSSSPVITSFSSFSDSFCDTIPDNIPSAAVPCGRASVRRIAVGKLEDLKLYPGGMPFGVKFITEGVLIVGFCDVKTKTNTCNPSTEAGLCRGDVILKIDQTPITGAAELTSLIENGGGKTVTVLYARGGKQYSTKLTPALCAAEAKYKSGIYVRDSGAGIGTVTFIVPDSYAFAGLGHGICDAETGELIPMQRGSVVGVTISGVVKGLAGSPGEVKGYFSSGKTGSLIGNTECGVYGVLGALPEGTPSEPIPVGGRNDVKNGKAHILCTLDTGSICKYDIEISDIQRDATSNKCFTVKVTDPALLEKTGGIIQGMSGSPIIQDGKLIGAVTHVLINDPATGYGIFVENMINSMTVM